MQMWKWVAAITPVKTCFKEFSSSPPACLLLLRYPVTLTSLYSVCVSAPATMSERRPVHRWLYYRQSLLHLLLLGWLHWPTMPDRWVMGWTHFLLLCCAWYTLWINACLPEIRVEVSLDLPKGHSGSSLIPVSASCRSVAFSSDITLLPWPDVFC